MYRAEQYGVQGSPLCTGQNPLHREHSAASCSNVHNASSSSCCICGLVMHLNRCCLSTSSPTRPKQIGAIGNLVPPLSYTERPLQLEALPCWLGFLAAAVQQWPWCARFSNNKPTWPYGSRAATLSLPSFPYRALASIAQQQGGAAQQRFGATGG